MLLCGVRCAVQQQGCMMMPCVNLRGLPRRGNLWGATSATRYNSGTTGAQSCKGLTPPPRTPSYTGFLCKGEGKGIHSTNSTTRLAVYVAPDQSIAERRGCRLRSGLSSTTTSCVTLTEQPLSASTPVGRRQEPCMPGGLFGLTERVLAQLHTRPALRSGCPSGLSPGPRITATLLPRQAEWTGLHHTAQK